MQPGNFEHSVLPQQVLTNSPRGNVGLISQESDFLTSPSTAGASMPQGDMLQDSNFIRQSQSLGSVRLLQNRRLDPLLSYTGFDVNRQTSGTVNSIFNLFSQIVQMDQTSQPPTPTTLAYTVVSPHLTTSCQAPQVH